MDITLNGNNYRTGRLTVKIQLHIARRIANTGLQFVLTGEGVDGIPGGVERVALEAGMSQDDLHTFVPNLMPMISMRALGELSQSDCDYVLDNCMSVVMRQQGTIWVPVINQQSGAYQFQDMGLKTTLELAVIVLKENLGDFFDIKPPNSAAPSEQKTAVLSG